MDAHSDLLLELTFAEDELGEDNPFRSRWLEQLERGGVAVQVCAIYVDAAEPDALRLALRQAHAFHAALRANADRVLGVRMASVTWNERNAFGAGLEVLAIVLEQRSELVGGRHPVLGEERLDLREQDAAVMRLAAAS